MDIIQTATKIATRLVPHFGKSKTIKQISTEIGQAADNELLILWNTVKPWFIKEYDEETPIHETFEDADVKGVVKKQLIKADDATKAAIEQALAQTKTSTKITNTSTITGNNNQVFQGIKDSNIQVHSGTGDNVAGKKD